MVLMPVMVMMVVMSAFGVMDGAVVLVTMLAWGFKFQRCVGYAVLGEFLADGFLNTVCVTLGNHVKRCVVVVTVHTPHVNVVNVLHTFNMRKMLANFIDFDAVGCFFKEEVNSFFEVANGIDENKGSNANGH